MKSKLLAFVEILLVYAVIQITGILRRSTEIVDWEIRTLGWSYTGMFIFVGIPALVIWLTRRDWAEYGVSRSDWRTNLDIGIKAYLVRIIPYVVGVGGAMWLMLDRNQISGGAFVALMEIVGVAVMLWVLNRQKPVKSGRGNVIVTILLLLFPIGVALAMNKLSAIVISTVVWQFVFSGFGEEFVWRGYVQSRLNQAFGRPMRMFGIQFGWGLIIASLLFGLLHAFNTYDPAFGFASLSWGWALSSSVAGLFFGLIREKTGTLLAPGIAHGLPDAVGEALVKVFGWM
ncbi:MAG: CPBP family intramembrane metalloprotease [Anaerolineales bacterium]|nr:CPBP family intramembrane metalloprotease [Anaerolineales bacterium]